MRNTQQGFTLIELVVVIVILGILAAIAVPKFISIQSDARTAVIQGVEGSVRGSAALIHAKALALGQTAATGSIPAGNIEGVTTAVALAYGYPNNATISTVVDIQGSSITVTPGAAGGAAAQFSAQGVTTATACQVTYSEPTAAGNTPTITRTTTNCN